MRAELLEALVSSVGSGSRASWSVTVGTLRGTAAAGAPLVDWPGNEGPPRPARWLDGAWSGPVPEDGRTVCVVLLVDASGTQAPVLAGILRDALPGAASPERVIVDGKRLELEAKEEIVLRCGEGSIRLTKDGTVAIRGRRLVSRSAEANVIRGATVKIN